MKQNNKNCIICGKAYTFCTNCSKFDHLPRWMGMFHSKKCKDIFDIISDYQSKVYTKKKSKNRLIDAGITGMTLTSPVQKIVDEIMSDYENYELSEKVTADAKIQAVNNDKLDINISAVKADDSRTKKKKAMLKN